MSLDLCQIGLGRRVWKCGFENGSKGVPFGSQKEINRMLRDDAHRRDESNSHLHGGPWLSGSTLQRLIRKRRVSKHEVQNRTACQVKMPVPL